MAKKNEYKIDQILNDLEIEDPSTSEVLDEEFRLEYLAFVEKQKEEGVNPDELAETDLSLVALFLKNHDIDDPEAEKRYQSFIEVKNDELEAEKEKAIEIEKIEHKIKEGNELITQEKYNEAKVVFVEILKEIDPASEMGKKVAEYINQIDKTIEEKKVKKEEPEEKNTGLSKEKEAEIKKAFLNAGVVSYNDLRAIGIHPNGTNFNWNGMYFQKRLLLLEYEVIEDEE
ncbi:MAG: hypothetical protein WCT85_00780 [Parachlamydiales bacterium]|jgi:hypothetical protein